MLERSYWLGFSLFPGVGPLRFKQLRAAFETLEQAWHASPQELQDCLGPALTEKFIDFRLQMSLASYEEKLIKAQVSYVTLADSTYPPLLAQISNPPFVLYCKGTFDFMASENSNTVGVVGARRITAYGEQVTEIFTQGLVDAGCVIVSGLALGVDAVAHRKTLAAGGKTIAVLGCGIDCPYPQENASLYAEILKHSGMIVSEYGLGAPATRGSFPSRNRIIAGLSRSVVVTEGAVDSGSLITAQAAFANDRPVFAVPGPINSRLSNGPYALIKKGATLVTTAQDVLDELGMNSNEGITSIKGTKSITGDTEEEQQIIALLQEQELSFDQLVKQTGMVAAKIGGILSLMELKGMLTTTDNNIFRLTT